VGVAGSAIRANDSPCEGAIRGSANLTVMTDCDSKHIPQAVLKTNNLYINNPKTFELAAWATVRRVDDGRFRH